MKRTRRKAAKRQSRRDKAYNGFIAGMIRYRNAGHCFQLYMMEQAVECEKQNPALPHTGQSAGCLKP